MYLLYDLILSLSALVLVPYYLLRGVRHGKVRRGIRERLGFYGPERLAGIRGKRVIWVHAVSVGETRAAIPLLKGLRQAYPEAALVLSNVTETGHAIAEGIREIDLCLFFPFDLSWVVRRVFRQVRPAFIVIVETEIWPNFVRVARQQRIPVVLVNGRISDRSFPRYRLARGVVRPILEMFTAFCMQTALDAERIARMGAPEDKIRVTRNLKFDMKGSAPDAAEVQRLKEEFKLAAGTLVWVAGSTHSGEEEIIAEVYRRLLDEGLNLLLILVPRHPERCRAVAEMLAGKGLTSHARSGSQALGRELVPGEVLMGDTLGEMLKFYAVADLVFVGGSLIDVGGHNVLEASLLKKPVVFGPYMHNFKEISRLLLESGGGMAVAGGGELADAVRRLLVNAEARERMGERGNALLSENAGATAETLKVIDSLLGP
ncbi:3-deoxy-D-manno-octulosonic acid transferase [Desulfuromonas versatilis]|uniref:3-deoxy-D-manno-octulosonic acid transferase n=1 Tax=Desulfuromonas versatilis TaxID=2802975 RepID=A0ABM8HXF1_9BACT|nr:3-deoxy-D-manno-octulosonic acid transferase [Desulfuromonas versatilis]BCR05201.1 3-deoxy-D-manno-octulosonic acid transferase [Desulfuromonas versatilis]